MRWRHGLKVLQRAHDEVQIGTDPRWAMRITGLDPAETRLLCSLSACSDIPIDLLARRHGVSPARMGQLDDALTDARLVVPASNYRNSHAVPPLPGFLGADVDVWSLVLDDADGAGLVRSRADSTVRVEGIGRTGLVVACALAAAGVGTVIPVDQRTVESRDLGVGGLRDRDLGRSRASAAARILHDIAPGVRTTGPTARQPDVVVRVEAGAADPVRSRELMESRVDHLSVVVREADVVVGPFVRVGTGACLRCVDLHRTEADRDWVLLAAQLSSPGPGESVAEESLLANLSGALAAGQIVAALDGRTPTILGSALEVGLPELVPRRREWSVHPECGCTDLPPAPPAPGGGDARRRRPGHAAG